ncbi:MULTISPECIES: hypothetical protein [Helicobacter]|uniref:Uncharacterized protein n=1 Tax=Helicobacter zhangjianzhongii TaxID=2974574 RepID=A0ACC6FPI2_9HELI|nr:MULTISPECIES: hypothetical protein [Helicobacter]MDL0079103.1 hypothetical protein [Helicobacter sp. CPD2-1]MDL0081130.1 hypothetical protein [Helicobacter sp. XJK30-2]
MGNHSGDLANFGVTADLMSSSTPKFAKSPTSNTAIPRIPEKITKLQMCFEPSN